MLRTAMGLAVLLGATQAAFGRTADPDLPTVVGTLVANAAQKTGANATALSAVAQQAIAAAPVLPGPVGGNASGQIAGIAAATSALQAALDPSLANAAWSAASSLAEAADLGETPTDLSVLASRAVIPPPDPLVQAAHSPTVSQFLNAANAAYTLNPAAPVGMVPFLQGTRQLAVVDQASGLAARVWLTTANQVIISYSGTFGGDTAALDPDEGVGQLLSDLPSVAGVASQAQKDALAFARFVATAAAARGIASKDVFVTGHSLGGGEAEYVAQQTGLGGMGFDGTGIPRSAGAVGTGDNFVSFDTYGDPWGSYASDVQGEQPTAPDFVPGGGELTHWGHLIMLGDVADQISLQDEMRALGSSAAGLLIEFGVREATYHYPGNQAADLGVTLFPYSFNQDTGGAARGTVFAVPDDTIGQVVADDARRPDWHAPSLPPR